MMAQVPGTLVLHTMNMLINTGCVAPWQGVSSTKFSLALLQGNLVPEYNVTNHFKAHIGAKTAESPLIGTADLKIEGRWFASSNCRRAGCENLLSVDKN